MSLRISARLDDVTGQKLADLQRETGKNVTDLISEALDAYYASHQARSADGNRALLALAGVFAGPADLSTRYKDELADALDGKHAGHR